MEMKDVLLFQNVMLQMFVEIKLALHLTVLV